MKIYRSNRVTEARKRQKKKNCPGWDPHSVDWCETGLGRSTQTGEMEIFGEISEQECDKNNSSPPPASQRGTITGTILGKRKKRSLQAGDTPGNKSKVQCKDAEAALIQNRSDKSLNPSCAFALWETQSTIHRKFINFLQSRGTGEKVAVDVNKPVNRDVYLNWT